MIRYISQEINNFLKNYLVIINIFIYIFKIRQFLYSNILNIESIIQLFN